MIQRQSVKNVYIGGVNVSGMTEEQATKAVEEKLGKGTGGNYTVKIGDETTTATAENFGMEWTNREVVHEAMEVAKGGNLIKQYKDKKICRWNRKTLKWPTLPTSRL